MNSSELETVPTKIGVSRSEPIHLFTDTQSPYKQKAYTTFFSEFLKKPVECVPAANKPLGEKSIQSAHEAFDEQGIRNFAACRTYTLVHSLSKEFGRADYSICTQKGLHIDHMANRGFLIAATAIWHRGVKSVATSGYIPLPQPFVKDLISTIPFKKKMKSVKKDLEEIYERHFGTEVAKKKISLCEYLYPGMDEVSWILEGVRYASAPFGPKSLVYYFVPPIKFPRL